MDWDASNAVLFLGQLCVDVVLSVPMYPREDAEVRTSSVEKTIGGNATNSALTYASLQRAGLARAAAPAFLLAATATGEDGSFAGSLLAANGVRVEGLVPLGAQLPTSWIALAPSSRTIIHSHPLPELLEGAADGAVRAAADAAGGALGWLHVEVRSPAGAGAALRAARALAPSAPRSAEFEKLRAGEGGLEVGLERALALAPLVDVLLVSAEFSASAGWAGARDAAPAADAAAASAGGAPPKLVVCPKGARGAEASFWVAGGGSRGWAEVPAHAPPGGVCDTLGAGDAFLGALVAFGAADGGAREFLAGGVPMGGEAALVQRWLRFAALVAGEKCGQRGLVLGEHALGRIAAANCPPQT